MIEFIGSIPVHLWEHMGVCIEGGANVSVSQAMLDDLTIDSCGNQRSRIAVAQIVQTDFREIRLIYEAFPLLGDGVWMEGLAMVYSSI